METSKVLRDMASELSRSITPETIPLITAETSSGKQLLVVMFIGIIIFCYSFLEYWICMKH